METINYSTLSELEDKYIGKQGNPKREEYERILSMDILGEKIKQLGKHVGVQKAQISKLENEENKSILGMFKGMFEISDDFDEPLEEFSE